MTLVMVVKAVIVGFSVACAGSLALLTLIFIVTKAVEYIKVVSDGEKASPLSCICLVLLIVMISALLIWAWDGVSIKDLMRW